MFAEKDVGFAEVGNLTRFFTKALEDAFDVVGFSEISLTKNEEIISKKKRMNLRTLVTKLAATNVVGVNRFLESD